ncbi:MAG: hypothetical protein HRT66_00195 [Flavobacteriaceae bacterium]|nr:hypothetical protein [Flavobacteriaceae bacterium]
MFKEVKLLVLILIVSIGMFSCSEEDDKSNESNISQLYITKSDGSNVALDKDYSPEVNDYKVYVPIGTLSLNVDSHGESESIKAIVVEGNENISADNNIITITVTAEDNSTNIYTISVILIDMSTISNYSIEGGITSYQDNNITVTFPKGTIISSFTPTFEYSENTVCNPNSGEKLDFSEDNTAIYTLEYMDGSTKEITVKLKTIPNSENDILSFVFSAEANSNLDSDIIAYINRENNIINVMVPYATDITSLIPYISFSQGAIISPNNGVTTDFTKILNYNVSSEDGSEKSYDIDMTFDIPKQFTKVSKEDGTWIVNENGTHIGVWAIEDLQVISDDLDMSYVLMKDLDFNNNSNYRNIDDIEKFTVGEGFKPLGDSYNNSFRGSFDGNNKTISNLMINTPDTDNVGLFGFSVGSSIENLGLIDCNIEAENNVAGLIGLIGGKVTIRNSYVTGNITANDNVGGFVGASDDGLDIYDSYSVVDITGNEYLGGLAGDNYKTNITSSYSKGSITGNSYLGGLMGDSSYSTVDESYSENDILGEGNYNGGLVGSITRLIITKSYATGSVNGLDYTGGLAGHIKLDSDITYSYATGDIEGNNNTGGLVGRAEDCNISTSYASGNVIGNDKTGGLVGFFYYNNETKPTLSNSYAIGNVTGNSGVGGLVGDMYYLTISSSYATGDIVATADRVGGLVGVLEKATIQNSIAFNSSITGTADVNRILGLGYNESLADNYGNSSVTVNGNTVIGSDRNAVTGGPMGQGDFDGSSPFMSFDWNINEYWEIKDSAVRPTLVGLNSDEGTLIRSN